MFGTMPGVDGVTQATLSTGATYPIPECPNYMSYDPLHDFKSANIALDGGAMDGFDLVTGCTADKGYPCICQYLQSDIPNFWNYASNYALYDEFHTSVLGPSFPNHLFTVAAWANNVKGNPSGLTSGFTFDWGCDANSGAVVQQVTALIPPPTTLYAQTQNISPCMDFPALPDLLNNAGLTWTYYSPPVSTAGFQWNSLDAISHIRFGSQWSTNIKPTNQFLTDAGAGTLPNVSWLVEPASLSGHPTNSFCGDENTVVALVNAVMNGPEWNSTAIFITFDDWGGFYDHVNPPDSNIAGGDFTGLGFRTPLIVVSPYAKSGYISHNVTEFSSFVTTVEDYYGLPRLGGLARDSSSSNLFDAFNMSQTPSPPQPLTPRSCPTRTKPTATPTP
jgi:phospholipase C